MVTLTPTGFFFLHGICQVDFNIYVEDKRAKKVQDTSEEEWGEVSSLYIKTYYKAIVIKAIFSKA